MTTSDLLSTLQDVGIMATLGPQIPTPSPPSAATGLTPMLEALLDESGNHRWAELTRFDPEESDALRALLVIYELWTAPLWVTRGRETYQTHPEVCSLKRQLEGAFIDRLNDRSVAPADEPGDTAERLRRIAAHDRVPAIYDWVAYSAELSELLTYIAIEGGPDAEFDDLVALAQIGIEGDPKVSLATNYWDEMGRGDPSAVHTSLHNQMTTAIAVPEIPLDDLGPGTLERRALNGLLATNRYLQPEALGAFGLLEMQAGPRCRAMVHGLRRLRVPDAALTFYQEHASADPHHGKEWLDRVITPLSRELDWGERMLRGARWRQAVNDRFFAEAGARLGIGSGTR